MNEFRKKIAIQLGISLGLIIILSGLLIYVFNDLKVTEESIKKEIDSMTKKNQEIENLSLLRQDFATAKTAMSQLKKVLPDRGLLFVFSEEANRLARERDLSLSFTFGNELLSESPSVPHRIDFRIRIEGGKGQILSFLNAFEASPYFTRVKNFELLLQGVGATNYQAMLSGEVFFSE